uniref:Gypsy retrotransposon integrase-like protein 1 n=1 Tax=Sparus aurata TaxID=8175 RepID=A0A671VWW5_SPAAU
MEFKLEEFTLSPSIDTLKKCKKADLIVIAESFDVVVPVNITKQGLMELLIDKLTEKGLFKEPAPAVGAELGVLAGTPAPLHALPTQTGMSAEELKLTLCIREVEVRNRELEVEAMHLRLKALEMERGAAVAASPSATQSPSQSPQDSFDVSRHIALVPPFRESEVDSYFNAFERIAATLKWPKNVWSLLLQCKLVGKAQEVCTSLSIEDSLKYDVIKATVLRAYQLVPEAYRQKFRKCEKTATQTYGEFAREKDALFDKWCQACKVETFDGLRELLLMEEFKNQLPVKIVIYLNEQKVVTLADAAVLADEFTLTHVSVFSSPVRREPVSTDRRVRSPNGARRNATASASARETRECFYCHKQGHLISVCPTLKRKAQIKQTKTPAPVNRIQIQPPSDKSTKVVESKKAQIDSIFRPFISDGSCSIVGNEKSVPITILRDTGAMQSLIRCSVLPFSVQSYCGTDVLVWGVKMSVIRAPLHFVQIRSQFVSGEFQIAVRPELPIAGVDFILSNDLAGGKVFPSPEVIENPTVNTSVSDPAGPDSLPLFPMCAITRAQARKFGDVVDLSDSFMSPSDPPSSPIECEINAPVTEFQPDDTTLMLTVGKEQLIKAQENDSTLSPCFSLEHKTTCEKSVSYLVDDGVLMRHWSPGSGFTHQSVRQIVVPQPFRPQVLSLAHDHNMSGHLGVRKTYQRILRYFFWLGLKSDVVKFCCSCHTCQISGKPNQVIPAAPLKPIPVIGEPFEHVIVDCVGPLPKTKSGNQYILTIMCAATRYPEAVPLRSLKVRGIVKALVKFFSTFGLPRRIQSDQGSNFMSKIFAQVMAELNVKHSTSSAYHPESQGALERFHQTLKTLLRKFCTESNREWDEGLPLLLFAVRETMQESLGFSPSDLVFGHTVRSPLRLLREKWLSEKSGSRENVLDYVSSFRERLHHAWGLSRASLSAAQSKMKVRYDKKSVARAFQSGDRVLVLLPVVGSALQAKFSGPYLVDRQLSETDYVIRTPDRRKKTRVCHINMLK